MGKVHGSYPDMKLGPPALEHVMGSAKEQDADGDYDADAPGMGHAHELIDAVHAKDGKRVLGAMKMLHKWAGSDEESDEDEGSYDDAPDSEG